MEECVRYTLTEDDIRLAMGGGKPDDYAKRQILQGLHWEVWEGLPPALPFEETPSRGGKIGWQAKTKGLYLWIPPDTYGAMQKLADRERLVFLVLAERRGNFEKFNPVTLADDPFNLPAAISKAEGLNREIILEAMKKKSPKLGRVGWPD